MVAVRAEALLRNGHLRTGLLDTETGIFVYIDHKVRLVVTVFPEHEGEGRPEYVSLTLLD